jgi:hypothetical protein
MEKKRKARGRLFKTKKKFVVQFSFLKKRLIANPKSKIRLEKFDGNVTSLNEGNPRTRVTSET